MHLRKQRTIKPVFLKFRSFVFRRACDTLNSYMQAISFIVLYCILLHHNTVVQQSAESLFRDPSSYKFSKGNSFSSVFIKYIIFQAVRELFFSLNWFPSLFSSRQPTCKEYFQDLLFTCKIPATQQNPPRKMCDTESVPQQTDPASINVSLNASSFHPTASSLHTERTLILYTLNFILWEYLSSSNLQQLKWLWKDVNIA